MWKIRLEQQKSGGNEVLIRYREMNEEVHELLDFLEGRPVKLLGRDDRGKCILQTEQLYYFECVDEHVFAYTREGCYQVDKTLQELEEELPGWRFFRCSKSLIVNMDKIRHLESMMGSRIDVLLDNGEHIVISRHYAGHFRELLKGGFYGEI